MKRMIRWFTDNSVAANLMMVIVMVCGLLVLFLGRVKKEIFPEVSADTLTIHVAYPGGAPLEVEEGICIKIEEAIHDLDGIKRLQATAVEGAGSLIVQVQNGYDAKKILDEIKSRVDAIDTFPEIAEEPVYQEVTWRFPVLTIAVYGPADERSLRRAGERVRDDLLELPGITQVALTGVRPYEVSIDVSDEALRRHGLTFDDVARAVRSRSLDMPGGTVKTSGGEILLRTKGQAYRGAEFEALLLMTRPDGTRVHLRDVASVVDGFAETSQSLTFDGQPAVMVQVFRVGQQNVLDLADTVKERLPQLEAGLPEEMKLSIWQDWSKMMRGRLELMTRNALWGLLLVFITLTLFLRLRLAFWVSLGIPISFLGAVAFMPALGVSLNMISMFSFILVLGIVVDDAIVVGESVFSYQQQNGLGTEPTVRGTWNVAIPVFFAVTTTIVVFVPMLTIPGAIGRIFKVIPLIVIPCLVFSLVECMLVLPAHLRRSRAAMEAPPSPWLIVRTWTRFQRFFADGLLWVIDHIYRPFLGMALRWRYSVLAAFVAMLIFAGSLPATGWLSFDAMPDVEGEYVQANLEMPMGASTASTAQVVERLEQFALLVKKEYQDGRAKPVIRHVMAAVGEQPVKDMNLWVKPTYDRPHLGEVLIELAPSEERTVSSEEIKETWRKHTGQITSANRLTYTADLSGGVDPINFQLTGPNLEELSRAADDLKHRLMTEPGVVEPAHSHHSGKREILLVLKPEAEAYGITLSDLGRQVRQAFYGEEVQRIQRGREDVKVMLRFPAPERQSLAGLEQMRIRAPDGKEIPFSTVALARQTRGYATIHRADRQRAINITASVDLKSVSADEIIKKFQGEVLPDLLKKYPDVTYSLEGEQKDWQEAIAHLSRGTAVAMLIIYALIAVVFRSYLQPLIVMAAIPFGVAGALLAHWILDMDLSIMSVLGIVALIGVVVNDSLVLVDYINRRRKEGMSLKEAIHVAGVRRFRPILLTSLTTFAGLTPLLIERSVQAKFLIPMGVALGFGVLFSTTVTLILVPISYMLLEDVKHVFRETWKGLKYIYGPETQPPPEEDPAVESSVHAGDLHGS